MAQYDAYEDMGLLSRAQMRFSSRAGVRAEMLDDVASDVPVRAPKKT